MGVGNWIKSVGNVLGSVPVVGHAVSAVGNLVGGAIQANDNKKMMREQMAWQNQQRLDSQRFQSGERVAQQHFQQSERELQNQYAEDMYNKYESPQAMVRQLKDAGLNPRLAAEGAGGSVAASSGSSGGAPSSGAPSAGSVAPPYQNIGAWSQGFQSMAAALKDIAEAKKLGLDTDYLVQTFNERVRQTQYKSLLDSLTIDGKKLENKNVAATYDKLVAELEKTNADTSQVIAYANYLQHLGALTKQQSETFKENFVNEQNHKIAQTDLFKAEKTNTEADTALKRDTSKLVQAQVLSEGARARVLRATEYLTNYEAAESRDRNERENKIAVEHVKNLQKEYDVLVSQAEKLRKEGKYVEWQMLNNTLSVVGQCISGYYIGKGVAGRSSAPSIVKPETKTILW